MPAVAFPGCAAWLPRRLAATLLAFALVVALAGCATTKASPTLTAAVTLDELGAVFISTADTYKTLHDAGSLDEPTWQEWRAFAQRFGVAWLTAKGLVVATEPGDPVATVMAMKDELFRWFLASMARKAEAQKGQPS